MLSGKIKLGGDKSISHRVVIFASIANDISTIKNISNSTDVNRTIQILRDCGVQIQKNKDKLIIKGTSSFYSKKEKFYCGNSGTTARLMLGFLPSRGVSGILYGDKSLSKRPMGRIIAPLKQMNIKLSSAKETLPVRFKKSLANPINYTLKVPSAQVKSSIILTAISLDEKSTIKDPFNTRDHTERLINFLNYKNTFYKKFKIDGFNYTVPGDISSAAFLITAGILTPKSNITIKNILFNNTRTGYIRVLKKMGAKISISNKKIIQNEPICDINVKYTSRLKAINLDKNDVIAMIDEIPIFSLVCAYSIGTSTINGAKELRYKESDRIHAIVYNFNKLKVNIKEFNDGFSITGPNMLYNTSINNFNDHRIALLGEIIKIINNKPLSKDFKTKTLIKTSFPEFYTIVGDIR